MTSNIDLGPAGDPNGLVVGGDAQALLDGFPDIPPFSGLRPDGLLAVLGRHPALSEPWQRFANALVTSGALPPRLRELVVLRVAWLRRSAYIWGGHVAVGARLGVSDRDLERVTEGVLAIGLTAVEAAVLESTDRMLCNDRVDRSTRATLEDAFDDKALIEVGMLVGQYVLVSCIVEAFRIPPEPGMVPLPRPRPPGPRPVRSTQPATDPPAQA